MGNGTSAIATGALASASTTTVASGRAFLNSLQVTTDGTNAGTVTVYDNTAGSGKVIAVLTVLGASLNGSLPLGFGIRCDLGLTFVVSGTGATAYASWGAA